MVYGGRQMASFLRDLDEYRALVAKVDDFAARVTAARQADLACRAGCDGCCQVDLTVSAVEAAAVRGYLEALPSEERAAVAARGRARLGGERGAPGCVMLDDRGWCGIYPARPLVCRTQGLPLRYPAELVPVESVRARAGQEGAVTWCELNFTARPPVATEVLDAERMDELLSVVNRRHAARWAVDPLERTGLVELAAQADG
jgi:hypothetical protein